MSNFGEVWEASSTDGSENTPPTNQTNNNKQDEEEEEEEGRAPAHKQTFGAWSPTLPNVRTLPAQERQRDAHLLGQKSERCAAHRHHQRRHLTQIRVH